MSQDLKCRIVEIHNTNQMIILVNGSIWKVIFTQAIMLVDRIELARSDPLKPYRHILNNP
jgi:hypothetical protein